MKWCHEYVKKLKFNSLLCYENLDSILGARYKAAKSDSNLIHVHLLEVIIIISGFKIERHLI